MAGEPPRTQIVATHRISDEGPLSTTTILSIKRWRLRLKNASNPCRSVITPSSICREMLAAPPRWKSTITTSSVPTLVPKVVFHSLMKKYRTKTSATTHPHEQGARAVRVGEQSLLRACPAEYMKQFALPTDVFVATYSFGGSETISFGAAEATATTGRGVTCTDSAIIAAARLRL